MDPKLDPAIQEDADGVDGDKLLAAHVQPLNPRDEAMAVIERRREAQLRGEEEQAAEAETTAAPVAAPAAAPSVDEQIAAQLAQDDKSTVLDQAALQGTRVKIKIDGIETEVPLEHVVRQFQKSGAADKRLAEATELLNKAKATTADTPNIQTDATASAATGLKPEAKKELLDALFSGDEEAASNALDKLFETTGRSQATTLDPNELARQALPAIKQQMDIDSALTDFQAKYAAIDADSYLAQRTASLAQTKMQAEGLNFRDALMASGAETLDWMRKVAGVADTPGNQTTTTQMTDRQTRKAEHQAISHVDAAAGTMTSSVTPPQSRQSILDELRQGRGQLTA